MLVLIKNVPFLIQAPFSEWKDPRQQDACEEASSCLCTDAHIHVLPDRYPAYGRLYREVLHLYGGYQCRLRKPDNNCSHLQRHVGILLSEDRGIHVYERAC